MSDLEEYYTEEFMKRYPNDQMPEFKSLNEDQKKRLKNSLGFTSWNLNRTLVKSIDLMILSFQESAKHINNFCEALGTGLKNKEK